MLVVKVTQLQFEYDIYSLIKAFFPEQDIKILLLEEDLIGRRNRIVNKKEDEKYINEKYINEKYINEKYINEKYINEKLSDLEIVIKFSQDKIEIQIHDNLNGRNSAELVKEIKITRPNERPQVKNELKQVMYAILADYTNKILPWGTLTGIRPTKIPMALLEKGMKRQDILQRLQDTYMISIKKGQLCLDIAEREMKLLADIHVLDGYSVYIGIPFCPTTCMYCSFTSYPISRYQSRVEEYLEAIGKELDFVADQFKHKILDTVYIGGGTPTTLSCEELEILLKRVKSTLEFANVLEFTVEAGRADTITREKLEILKRYGVTRISVNPQSMKAETLKLIGRNHTIEQVEEAFYLAREVGFTNINMDIILGLPEENKEDVIRTIEAIQKLGPDSLTVHSLAIKRASKLQEWIEENGIKTLNNTAETMDLAAQGAKQMGMEAYYLYRQKNMSGNFENIGYATPGNYGIYNIIIMEEKQDIVAVGAGAASKKIIEDRSVKRCECVKDVGLYIDRIDEMIERKRKLFAKV